MRDVSFETMRCINHKSKMKTLQRKASPIHQTSSFSFKNLDELESYFEGETPYLYSRYGNPNTDELGSAVAALEGAEGGVASSSGMSAILAGFLAVVKNGDHIVACDDLYGGTYHLLDQELKNFGMDVTFVYFANETEVRAAVRAKYEATLHGKHHQSFFKGGKYIYTCKIGARIWLNNNGGQYIRHSLSHATM